MIFRKEIKSKQEAIDELTDIYMIASNFKLAIGKKLNLEGIGITQEEYERYRENTKEGVFELLHSAGRNEDDQIKLLKIIIENIIEENIEVETQRALNGSDNEGDLESNRRIKELKELEQMYLKALIKIKNFEETEKAEEAEKTERIDPKKVEEQKVLSFIKKLNLTFHGDVEEDKEYRYGDLIRTSEYEDVLYCTDKIIFEKMEGYQVSETPIDTSDFLQIVVGKKNLNRYRLSVRYESGEMARISFFADKEIGELIANGEIQYLNPMLAAVAKAKEENREYIGKLTLIDEQLQTYITTYDENLESVIKKSIKGQQTVGNTQHSLNESQNDSKTNEGRN